MKIKIINACYDDAEMTSIKKEFVSDCSKINDRQKMESKQLLQMVVLIAKHITKTTLHKNPLRLR